MKHTKKITILHSNDLHGDFLAEQVDEKLVGGVSMLSGYIEKVRAEQPNTLYVIAGEAFPGRPGFFKQEAIDADDYSGVTFLTDKRDGETYVEAKDFRSFLVYKNMDLTGCNAFECAMSAPSGDVEILLADNKTGKVLGKAGGTGTGSLTKFTSFTCDIAAEAGLTELRIVFTKQTSLKWFRFYTV